MTRLYSPSNLITVHTHTRTHTQPFADKNCFLCCLCGTLCYCCHRGQIRERYNITGVCLISIMDVFIDDLRLKFFLEYLQVRLRFRFGLSSFFLFYNLSRTSALYKGLLGFCLLVRKYFRILLDFRVLKPKTSFAVCLGFVTTAES